MGFDDLAVLTDEGVEVFVLNLNERAAPPPYHIFVEGRRFRFTGDTFLVLGRGASLPRFLAAQEEAGVLVLLAERADRHLVYVHDPPEKADESAEEPEPGESG